MIHHPLFHITFVFLKAFLLTGGIEKVNRVLLLALHELEQSGRVRARALSPYATGSDARYFPGEKLRGYGGQRWQFMFDLLWRPLRTDILLIGHINLAPAVRLLKWRYPKLKIVVMAHGIEVWPPVTGLKRWLLLNADQVLAVSQFTRHKMLENGVAPGRVLVLPNCLDPYFQPPAALHQPAYLLERYGLQPGQKVLLTIARLSAYEGYKGYDRVIESLPALLLEFPDLLYILGGKYDALEKERLDQIIDRLQLRHHVLFTGFVPDTEVLDHYRLADAFVMPSKKEGFGLVFIEAMACGTPAIGGDQDGSPEALRPGELGYTTNPDDPDDIVRTISTVLRNPPDARELQRKTLDVFRYEAYRERLAAALQLPENHDAAMTPQSRLQQHYA